MYNNAKVRCWKIDVDFNDSVFVTYPDGFGGHDLIICMNCGEIYAADTTSQLYEKPLDEKLINMTCRKCGKKLSETYKIYPDNYINSKGVVAQYIKENIYPDDKLSIVKEFPSIYNMENENYLKRLGKEENDEGFVVKESLEKETGEFEIARSIMRLGLLFGAVLEFMIIVFVLAIPFYLWNLIAHKSFEKSFELSGLVILVILAIGIFIYIGYLFVSNRIFGRTFSQVNFKSVAVRVNNEKMEPRDIARRILAKILIATVWFGLGLIISIYISHGAPVSQDWPQKIKNAIVFAFLISPILLIPFLSEKTQTITDYFSRTKVLINYEQIKQEEKGHLNEFIENPWLLLAGAPTVSMGAIFFMIGIAYMIKFSKKRF